MYLFYFDLWLFIYYVSCGFAIKFFPGLRKFPGSATRYMYLLTLPIRSLLFSLPLRLIFLQHQMSSSIQPLPNFIQFSIPLLSLTTIFPLKNKNHPWIQFKCPQKPWKKISKNTSFWSKVTLAYHNNFVFMAFARQDQQPQKETSTKSEYFFVANEPVITIISQI